MGHFLGRITPLSALAIDCCACFFSAAAAVIQRPLVQSGFNDTLFVMGGFGGWPEDDSRYNGMRCRNDVYKTKDGGEKLRQRQDRQNGEGGERCMLLRSLDDESLKEREWQA